MKVKTIVNHYNTRGIVRFDSSKAKLQKIPGYFNKQYFKEIMRYLDSFGEKSVAISFKIDEDTHCAMMIISPYKKSDVALAIAGRTEP